ncbi:MAG: Gfo/Idh/MocA family oxidoreductase [Cyanobacteria bacterium J06621_11]
MVIRVGLVGTGYAAVVRAKSFEADERSALVAVAGRNRARTAAFADHYGLNPAERWLDLIDDDGIDLVVVATVSALHGEVAEAALKAGKHVVVEYPLSLDLAQAERLLLLARQKKRLLHVEHIELLGGLHQVMRSHLSKIGQPSYVNYRTLTAQHPAPTNWKYAPELFGFPFCGALSRVNRLINLFGRVKAVSCETQQTESAADSSFYTNILCSGRLRFENELVAEVTYGKGDRIWTSQRAIEVHGNRGSLAFVGNQGRLTTDAGSKQIESPPRKGLLALDTTGVLDYLSEGSALYVSAKKSIYALKVGDALKRASEQQTTILVDEWASLVC